MTRESSAVARFTIDSITLEIIERSDTVLPRLKDKKVVHVLRRTVQLSSIPCVIVYITAAREQP